MSSSEMQCPLKPVGNHVVVQMGTMTVRELPSGLIVPETSKWSGLGCKGVVVAVGSGELTKHGKRIPIEVQPGDVVMFSEYAGERVEKDGVQYRIFEPSELLAVKGERADG